MVFFLEKQPLSMRVRAHAWTSPAMGPMLFRSRKQMFVKLFPSLENTEQLYHSDFLIGTFYG
jgi:hypothetical protein